MSVCLWSEPFTHLVSRNQTTFLFFYTQRAFTRPFSRPNIKEKDGLAMQDHHSLVENRMDTFVKRRTAV